MTEKITVTFEIDADLKAEAEKLYSKIDLTLAEAIPFLIKYNVEQEDGDIPRVKPPAKKKFCVRCIGGVCKSCIDSV